MGFRSSSCILGLLLMTSLVLLTSASTASEHSDRAQSDDDVRESTKKEIGHLIRLLRGELGQEKTHNAANGNSGNAQTRNSVCSADVVLTTAGSVESPNYPLDYPNFLDCVWILEGPPESHVSITFPEDVDIEGSQSATCYDLLTIKDGGDSSADDLGVICGEIPVQNILTSGNKAYVTFSTDVNVRKSGFYFDFTFQSSSTSGCSGITDLGEDNGQVSSPGYPADYPNYSDCGWRIQAPENDDMVEVTFETFDLENENDCLYDSLSIYDGGSDTSPLVGKYCGDNSPGQFTSSGSKLLLNFHSDFSQTFTGFRFTYTFKKQNDQEKDSPACSDDQPQIIDAEEGEFSSDGVSEQRDYQNNLRCSWKIIVPATQRAHLHFTNFALEGPENSCPYDSLKLFDGEDANGVSMGTYCGNTGPGDVTATGNVIFVKFKTDGSVTAAGFSVTFSGKAKPTDEDGGQCGMQAIDPKFSRIVGGMETIPHSWPWQVSIRNRDYNNFGHWCGGSIIDPEWVVTAAHCVVEAGATQPKAQFKVIAGAHKRDEADASQVTVELRELIVHENYNSNSNDNDIALFRLATPLTYSSEISAVCIPNLAAPDRTFCVTTGWGATEGTADNAFLQQVNVPKVEHEQCNQWYAMYGGITANMECFGYPEGRKDSCQGDSGGPLVCAVDGAWTLAGITSWGAGCAEVDKPGVYTRVVNYVDWIAGKTGVGA